MFSQFLNVSNYYFNIYALPSTVVGVLIFSIGLFVLAQNKKSAVNIAFFLQCFSVAIWVFTISFVYSSRDPAVALIWYKYLTFFGVVNIMPSFNLLANAWAGTLARKKVSAAANYAICIVFYILAVSTDKIIDPHQLRRYFWGFYPIYKPLALAFILVYILQYADAIRILYQAQKQEKTVIKKTQVLAIIIATLVAMLASVDFIPKFFYISLYPLGYLPIFTYVCLVAYSVVKYKMFDIETAIHKTGMWVLSFSFIIIPMFFLYRWCLPYIIKENIWHFLFWSISFLILAFYLRVVQPKIDHFFQRRQSNLEEISSRFTEDLVHLKGLNQLIQRIEDTISDTMYPEETNIFIYNEALNAYKLANVVKKSRDLSDLPHGDKFLQHLAALNKIAYKEFIEIDPAYAAIMDESRNYFQKTGALVVIPLVLNDNLLGVINLSRKASLRRYSGSDFHFLTTLKNQATIAISNSLLYENMEEKVRQRTNELVQVQKQLVQAEKLATVGTLAGGVAHEINNPLTAILTNVQMLLASDTVDDKLDRESLELIEEATKRCRTIVQKLMTYARRPLETTQVSQINLLDVLKDVLSFIGYQLEQDTIKIVIDAKSEGYPVMGNHNELEQVLTNLILNARDAVRSAKKSGVVNIAFSKSAEWIKVDIRDEGMGIPKEIASKIFDPFFTTKDVGKGVGLGLSICQALIEKHKGMMTFRSEPGRGSVFTIQLPRAEKWDKAGAAKEAVKHEHPQKPLIDKLAKKNILIIDDDGIITKTLCDLLKEAGYYADASQNGFDAVDKTRDAVFDLIIADIKMPGMDGVATIKKIKEASKANGKPDIPTIFITGYADSRAALEAKKIGEVIAKPFDTKEFLAKVAKYI